MAFFKTIRADQNMYVDGIAYFGASPSSLFIVFTIIYLVGFQLLKRTYHEGLAYIHFQLLLVGTVLTLAPSFLLRATDDTTTVYFPTRLAQSNTLAYVGSWLVVASFLVFGYVVIHTIRSGKRIKDINA